jgi:hypothetical protein
VKSALRPPSIRRFDGFFCIFAKYREDVPESQRAGMPCAFDVSSMPEDDGGITPSKPLRYATAAMVSYAQDRT